MKLVKGLVNYGMHRRAKWVKHCFDRELHPLQSLLDVGSGTGNFGDLLRTSTSIKVSEIDICDFSITGTAPLLFDGVTIPVHDKSFDAVSLIAMLQYCTNPDLLLREVARVARYKILIVQTISTVGLLSASIHRLEELIEGKLAWHSARLAGCFETKNCPLAPSCYPTEEWFNTLLQQIFIRWRTLHVKNSMFPGIKHHFVAVEP